MYELETLVVPEELAYWITKMHGENISSLRMVHLLYVETGFKQETNAFIYDNEDKIIEAIIGTRDYEAGDVLFYALVKGHLLIQHTKYWNFNTTKRELSINAKNQYGDVKVAMTESEWSELGINDTNADFVEVEEVEQ